MSCCQAARLVPNFFEHDEGIDGVVSSTMKIKVVAPIRYGLEDQSCLPSTRPAEFVYLRSVVMAEFFCLTADLALRCFPCILYHRVKKRSPDCAPHRSCAPETPTPRAPSQPTLHCSSQNTLERASVMPPCPMRSICNAVQSSASAQHDQNETQLHTPRLPGKRHAFVAQRIRTDLCTCHVRRQLLVDGSRASFHHEAPVGPCLFAVCNPVLSFDQRVLGAFPRIQLFRRCQLQELQASEHLMLALHPWISTVSQPITTTKLLRCHDTYMCCFALATNTAVHISHRKYVTCNIKFG